MIRKLLFITIFFLLLSNSNSTPSWAKKEPKVLLESDLVAFSPNKDGIQDQVSFRPVIKNIKSVSTWELQLRDAMGSIRRTFSGSKNIPESIQWNGTDDFGAPCAEGNYQAFFSIWDSKHKQLDAPSVKVALDLTPPTISLTSQEKTAELKEELLHLPSFYISAVDLSGISNWKIRLQDEKKEEIYSKSGDQTIPNIYAIPPLVPRQPPEKLTLFFTVMDRAGNSSDAVPLEFPVKRQKTKKQMEMSSHITKVSEKSKAKEVEGPYLQMATIIFLSELFGANAVYGTPLHPQASTLLNPIAKTLLDTLGSRATILGHVDATNNPEKDKALSSYFAWRVYSYLVKEKEVPAEALTVKGLGSSVPIAENRTPLGRARNRRIEIQFYLPHNHENLSAFNLPPKTMKQDGVAKGT